MARGLQINGGMFSDVLQGGSKDDVISGGFGDDTQRS